MIKICQAGSDGFGHQLEGMLRMISLSLNNKAEYLYNFRKEFSFEHSNFNKDTLTSYLLSALKILSDNSVNNNLNKEYNVLYGEQRTFQDILANDKNYMDTIYCYDGAGNGKYLPPNFEEFDQFKKSLPALRRAFILDNPFLPKPSYNSNSIVFHIRLGDAVNSRILDNEKIYKLVKHFQKNLENNIIIHTDGDVDFLKSENTTIYHKNTDVLQILSDFVHANTLVINYSALSIAGHLLADESQKVICPNIAGPTFFKRISEKCVKMCNYNEYNRILNKTYSWEDDTITFLENGKIRAFGEGKYRQEDEHVFLAIFGGKTHRIIFNDDDYTKYISIRLDDLFVIKGHIMV